MMKYRFDRISLTDVCKKLAVCNNVLFGEEISVIYDKLKQVVTNPVLLEYISELPPPKRENKRKHNDEYSDESDDEESTRLKYFKRPYATYYTQTNYVVVIPAPRKGSIKIFVEKNELTVTYKYLTLPLPEDCEIEINNQVQEEKIVFNLPPPNKIMSEAPKLNSSLLDSFGYFMIEFELVPHKILTSETIHF